MRIHLTENVSDSPLAIDQNYISLLYGSLRCMQNCNRMYAMEYIDVYAKFATRI